MKPFVRLRDGELSDAERQLLDSATDDVPSFGAREKTLAALGVAAGASLVAPGVAHAAVQGAAGTSGAAASAVKAGSVTSVLVLKWLGTGALVGAIAATGVATITTPGLFGGREAPAVAPVPPGARAIVPARALPRAGAVPLVAPAAEAAPLRPVDEIPSVAPLAAEARPERGGALAPAAEPLAAVPPPPGPAAAATGNVMAEVASLDRARAALAARDATGALARLAAHEAAFPRGALLPEAILLRVRALRELGRYEEASAVAERFLASNPDSAQAARLRALVGAAR